MKSYVCVLSTDNYLDGVLVLNENLQRMIEVGIVVEEEKGI